MSDAPNVWPPAPNRKGSSTADPTIPCPHCGRKLLTQTSALCNWCGAKIDDDEYQQRAATSRLERDEAERAALEAIAQEEAEYGILGRLKRRAKKNASRQGGSGNELLP